MFLKDTLSIFGCLLLSVLVICGCTNLKIILESIALSLHLLLRFHDQLEAPGIKYAVLPVKKNLWLCFPQVQMTEWRSVKRFYAPQPKLAPKCARPIVRLWNKVFHSRNEKKESVSYVSILKTVICLSLHGWNMPVQDKKCSKLNVCDFSGTL